MERAIERLKRERESERARVRERESKRDRGREREIGGERERKGRERERGEREIGREREREREQEGETAKHLVSPLLVLHLSVAVCTGSGERRSNLISGGRPLSMDDGVAAATSNNSPEMTGSPRR